MPRRDGTGPDGFGPNTGRGLGPCDDNAKTQFPALNKYKPKRIFNRRSRALRRRWRGNR